MGQRGTLTRGAPVAGDARGASVHPRLTHAKEHGFLAPYNPPHAGASTPRARGRPRACEAGSAIRSEDLLRGLMSRTRVLERRLSRARRGARESDRKLALHHARQARSGAARAVKAASSELRRASREQRLCAR
jgi:hypothetical protein